MPQSFLYTRIDTLVFKGNLTMPIELPEDRTEKPLETEDADTTIKQREQIISLTSELVRVNNEKLELSKKIEDLSMKIEEVSSKKNEVSDKLDVFTKQLDQVNIEKTDLEAQLVHLNDKIQQAILKDKEKTKKVREFKTQLERLEEQLSKREKEFDRLEKTSMEREEQLLEQLEAMAEQIGKLRGVIAKRDEELVALQKDILVKKNAAQDAQEEANQLRTVGIIQREAVQDTSVLRRRVTDLEVELDQLKKALEKDSKYRIYLLVRETGERTLEELSKILGVGIFEARRRVQELVRAGLLELKEEKAYLARRV